MTQAIKRVSCVPVAADKSEDGWDVHFRVTPTIGWRSEQPDTEWAQLAYDDAVAVFRAVDSHASLLAACKAAAERGYSFGDLGLPGVEMPSRETLIKWSEEMFALYSQCEAAIAKAEGANE